MSEKKVLRARGRRDNVSRLLSKLNAARPRKGEATFEVSRTNNDILSRVKYTLKTGIDALDLVAGGPKYPGLPFGRIIELFGLDASGKTALAMRAAVQAQKQEIYQITDDGKHVRVQDADVTILYVDNEQSITDDEKIIIEGVEIDCVIGRCDTIDQLFKMIDLTIDQIAAFEAEDREAGRGIVQFGLIVVDTIASTASKEELAADWDKDDYPRQPKMLRRAFRSLMNRINRHNVMLLATNQVSEAFLKSRGPVMHNVAMADKFVASGGRALRFYARLRIFVHKINDRYKIIKGSKYPAGFVSEFETLKNSQAFPNRSGRLVLLYTGGLSNIYSLLETFISAKIADVTDEGKIVFRFKEAGIYPQTFALEQTKGRSLDEDDDEEEVAPKPKRSKGAKVAEEAPATVKVKNPSISSRAEWPAYYESHRADFDKLWEHLSVVMFQAPALPATSTIDDDDDDVEDDEDDDFDDDDDDDEV